MQITSASDTVQTKSEGSGTLYADDSIQQPPEIKALLDYVALDKKFLTAGMVVVNSTPGFEPIIKTDEDVEYMLGHRGTEMYKVGIIAQDQFKVKYTPVPRQKDIGMLGYHFILPISARVIVQREYNGWYFIRSFDGQAGWVEGFGLAFDPPEPTAVLYEVKSNDNLFNLVKTYYGLSDKDDKRLHVNAVVFANRASGRKKQFKDTATPGLFEVNDQYHHNPQLVKGTTLWLPSQQFIDELKKQGKISSGSFTEEMWNAAKKVIDVILYAVQFIIAFVGGLVAGFVMSIVDTVVSIVSLAYDIVKLIIGIFTGETIDKAKEIYEAVKNLTWDQFKEILAALGEAISSEIQAYWKRMTSDDPWEAGYAWGYLIGYIIGLIVLTYFTLGSGLLARIGTFMAKYFGKAWAIILRILAKVRKVTKKIPGLSKLRKVVSKKKKVPVTPITMARRIYKITLKIRNKILWGEKKGLRDIIGGHFRGIIGHPNYVTQYVGTSSFNPGCDIYKFIKGLPGNVLSNIKTSTFFPKGWSKSKIIRAIEEAANNPFKTEVLRPGVIRCQKKIDGIWVQTIIENGEITAGYPLKAASELIP